MNISQVSIPVNVKKVDSKTKGEAQLGKVISKNGKEIQVLIKDKVYKIEPGNAQKIKTGDVIQVFFGKDLPQEISSEVLKKIGAKLLDVYSLSLPFKTSQELEGLINSMPQHEKMRFAQVSNQISSLAESIIKEDFNMEVKQSVESTKNAFDLYDPRLPFNRRLVEISLKAKAMGEAWDNIPDTMKKEIIKEFVLYDLNKLATSEKKSDSVNEFKTSGDHIESKKTKTAINVEIKKSKSVIASSDEPTSQKRVNNLTEHNTQSKSETKLPSQNEIKEPVHIEEKKNLPNSEIRTGLSENKKASIIDNLSDNINKSEQKTSSEKTLQKTPDTQQFKSKFQNTVYNMTENTLKEEFIKNTVNELKDLLKELLSKPINLEKNQTELGKISQKSIQETVAPTTTEGTSKIKTSPVLESVEKMINKDQIPPKDKNIINILNKLVKSNFSGEIDFDSVKIDQKIFSQVMSTNFNFETVKNDPMMNFEIKNLIKQLSKMGISLKESALIANDIVNLSVRSFKDSHITQSVFPNSLKNYLKLKLPQLIVDNKIEQASERTLINRVHSFSQKAYIIVKDFVHKLVGNTQEEIVQNNRQLTSENKPKNAEQSSENKSLKSNPLKNDSFSDNILKKEQNPGTSEKLITDKPEKSISENLSSAQKKQILNSLEESRILNNKGKEIPIIKEQLNNKHPVLNPENKNNDLQQEKFVNLKNAVIRNEVVELKLPEKTELNSEKLLKMLNITSDKNDFNHVYSAVLNFNEQNFAVDFQKQSVANSGYEKKDMYRVYIETDTQRFGNVFIDTVVTGKNLDIYIYAGQAHTKEFTNHSSVLSKG
jgi:hypothetical protein